MSLGQPFTGWKFGHDLKGNYYEVKPCTFPQKITIFSKGPPTNAKGLLPPKCKTTLWSYGTLEVDFLKDHIVVASSSLQPPYHQLKILWEKNLMFTS